MNTSFTRPRVVVTARVDPEMLEQLRRIAAREERSIGGELRLAVAEHVARKARSQLADKRDD
jgi:hypothetical protein